MSHSSHPPNPPALKQGTCEPLRSIWLIHDHKPGHLSQLEGLGSALQDQTGCTITWVDARSQKRPSKQSNHPPQIVLGAGHKTHLQVLRYAQQLKAFSALLMKPSLPLRWFSAVICPEHDGLQENSKILTTVGAINKVKSTRPQDKTPDAPNVFLLGGPSKHYHWDSSVIHRQLDRLVRSAPDQPWLIYNSPRSPEALNRLLEKTEAQYGSHVRFRDRNSCTKEELSHALEAAAVAWVTPDSVSMVYEALTAGCATGLLALDPAKTGSKVRRGIDRLVQKGWLTNYSDFDLTKPLSLPPHPLDEATRAARWLIERHANWHASRIASKVRKRL